MSAARTRRNRPPVKGHMLRWAREWRQRSIDAAAKKVGKRPEDIEAWEREEAAPTVRQARILADFYDRAFLEFFWESPPAISEPQLVPDFRVHRGHVREAENRELELIQQWAEIKRENALDLLHDLGEQPAQIPDHLFTNIDSDADAAARRAREALNFPIHEQIRLTRSGPEQLPNILRKRLESAGVLTLRSPKLRHLGVRGICIATFPLSVIVFGTEAPTAQAFTLSHELAHVLVGKSGITGPRRREYEGQPVEKWCDQFAAAFLMPREQLVAIIGEKPERPSPQIDDAELARHADIFRVSPHAMLIRLVHLGYVASKYYWDVKKPQFDLEEARYHQFGRSKYYGSRYKSSLGDLYTGLVLEAWSTGRITNHNAAEYMGIKNLAHLREIRDNFGSP